ncbi:MAG TPA: anti-sigma factor [Candidatus Ruania gallistercoris]|uniref:Regulator of SigK n=1 Tax=Candidatus Ruania gallistercoris TaxID=2838746 RepID=A0A9D2J352_9MICO|nr:anti-sigma factor [Candidatus Ruania gallistercoris]
MVNEPHPRELLGAWAVDAVDDVERRAVERLLREDPDAAVEARELQEVVGRLAGTAAAEPPATLRDRVLGAIEDAPQERAPGRTPAHAARRATPRRRQLRWWAAAAAVLAAVAVPTGIAIQQEQRAARAEDQVQAITEALAESDAVLVTAPVTGGGHAAMVRSADGALVALRDLPALTDRDYQLWLIEDDVPSSAGVLSARDGLATAQVSDTPAGAALAVTIEPTGGSTQPTSDPVVVLSSS